MLRLRGYKRSIFTDISKTLRHKHVTGWFIVFVYNFVAFKQTYVSNKKRSFHLGKVCIIKNINYQGKISVIFAVQCFLILREFMMMFEYVYIVRTCYVLV